MRHFPTSVSVARSRRAGELLTRMDLKPGPKRDGDTLSRIGPGKKSLTLTDLGLSANQSSRWQRIASVPEADFDAHIAEAHRVSAWGTPLLRRSVMSETADSPFLTSSVIEVRATPSDSAISRCVHPKRESRHAFAERDEAPAEVWRRELRREVRYPVLRAKGASVTQQPPTDSPVAAPRSRSPRSRPLLR